MYTKIFFLVYIFAGFAGGLAILMAVLLIKYWSSGNKRLLAAIRNFMICTALIDALYFYFDYDMLVNGDYSTNALCRVLDICLFIGQVYFWTAYVRMKTMKDADSLKRLEKFTRAVIGICVVMAVAGYGFMMSDYYQAPEGPGRTRAIIIEAVLMTMLTFINLWNVKYALSEIIQKKCRRYIICITIMLVVNGVWNGILVISLLNGELSYVRQNVMDPTPVFFLVLSTLTILLILSEDFTALFKADSSSYDDSAGGAGGCGSGSSFVSGAGAATGGCEDASVSIPGISVSESGSVSGSDALPGSGICASGSIVSAGGNAASNTGIPRISVSGDGGFPCSNAGTFAGGDSSAWDIRENSALQKRLDYIAETHFLTEREREVMELAYYRMTNPEIAEKLCISKYTVKNHMHNIFEKLDISARADLIMFVDKSGQPGKGRE